MALCSTLSPDTTWLSRVSMSPRPTICAGTSRWPGSSLTSSPRSTSTYRPATASTTSSKATSALRFTSGQGSTISTFPRSGPGIQRCTTAAVPASRSPNLIMELFWFWKVYFDPHSRHTELSSPFDLFPFLSWCVSQSPAAGLSSSSRRPTPRSQEARWLWTAPCTLEPAAQNTVCTGSKRRIQETPTWEWCTSTAAAVSVHTAWSLLHWAVCTAWRRGTWAGRMPGCITAPWRRVERSCSGKEHGWRSKVSKSFEGERKKNPNKSHFFLFCFFPCLHRFFVFSDTFPFLMQCSVAALLVSGVLNIVLVGVLCKMSRRKHLHPQGAINSYLPERSIVLSVVSMGIQGRIDSHTFLNYRCLLSAMSPRRQFGLYLYVSSVHSIWKVRLNII